MKKFQKVFICISIMTVFILTQFNMVSYASYNSKLTDALSNISDSPLGFFLILFLCAIPIILIELVSRKTQKK